jgi:hypothetical protein
MLAGDILVYRYRRDLFPRDWDNGVRVVAALVMGSAGSSPAMWGGPSARPCFGAWIRGPPAPSGS